MTELSRDARSVIAHARAETKDAASAEDRARIRAKLDPVWAAFRAQQSGAAGAEPNAARRVSRYRTPWLSSALWWSLALWTPALPSASPLASAGRDEAPAGAAVVLRPMAAAAIEQAPYPTLVQPALATPSAQPVLLARRKSPSPLGTRASKYHTSLARTATRRGAEAKAVQLGETSISGRTAAVGGEDAARDDTSRSVARLAGRTARADLRPLAGASASTHAEQPAATEAPTQRNSDFVAQPLDDELQWIGAAQEALREGQPSRVLRLVQQHAFRFPQGALTPERLALHALALCALQRQAAARTVLTDLEQRAPSSSPLLERVRRNCGL